ncbi:MJ0042-type zinc finger domain-containing protein [Brevundimonas vesicularis]|uniref:MJ0042-type zinc finger domain-containing protein n=1 Tax=Brevundimonas vesicularis TaxID=41276 RepID=UPI0038D38880
MILTCPACATSYFVPDDAIGANGRRVRCKSCGHDWRATLEDEPLELSSQAGQTPSETNAAPDILSATLAETPAPELPRAFRAKAERRRRMRQAATQGAAWVALIVVLTGLVLAALVWRLPIVQAWPQTASLYKAIGFTVNVTGVEPEAVRGRLLSHDPGRVVAAGALRNIRDHEVVPPPVIVVLRDDRDHEVARQRVVLDGPPILPGKVQGFAAILDNPEGKGTRIAIEFALESEASAAVPKSAEKSAPAARALPVAEAGLRPATAYDSLPPEGVPLDKKGP